MSWAGSFPLDIEGALIPFTIASLAAVLMPAPYVWWLCVAELFIGTGYLLARRRQALKPWLYVTLHALILAALVAGVVWVRRPTA